MPGVTLQEAAVLLAALAIAAPLSRWLGTGNVLGYLVAGILLGPSTIGLVFSDYEAREILDFAEFARTCWFGPLDVTDVPLVEGDLAIQGERLDEAPAEAVSAAHSAAQERHQAANWLWEGPAVYSQASVAT